MTFLELKTNVQSAFGRNDIPDFVYEFTTSDINRDVRTIDMETTATLSVNSEFTNLPTDFLEMVSVYIDDDTRVALRNVTANAANSIRRDSGEPWGYSIVNGQIKLIPTPDGSYNLNLRYMAELSELSLDSDTNVILGRYPSLYHYGALRHVATWAQDLELAGTYQAAFDNEKQMVKMSERKRKHGAPFTLRPSVDMSPR